MILVNDITHFILPVLVAHVLMSFISLPFSNFFFKSLSDKGYSLSGLIGWICTAYIYFFTATFFELNIYTLSFSIISWALINLYILSKNKDLFKQINWKHILQINLGFIAFFMILYLFTARNPELYQIERFMDFGFIKALFNSQTLPPKDSWLIGKSLNYYYFGHFLAYTILKITGIPAEQGFFIINCWIFTNVCTNIYRISHDYLLSLVKSEKLAKAAGLISIFLFQFAGTFFLLKWLKASVLSILNNTQEPSFWYADIARSIKDTITEVPFFSFLEATSHAHVFGFLNGIIVLSILYSLWIDEAKFNLKNKYLYLLSFFLGIAYLTNSWNIVTLSVLSVFIILSKFKIKFNKELLMLMIFNLAILILVISPWQIFFHNPLGGIGIVKSSSPAKEFLMFWGAFLTLGVLSGFYGRKEIKFKFFASVFFACMFFLVLIESIYFKDVMSAGDWYKANTVFKITSELWLWFSTILGASCAYIFSKSKKASIIVCIVLAMLSIYPINTLNYIYSARAYTGLSNPLSWFANKYPGDYEGYKFLKDNNYKGNIVEAEGESYTDTSFFSTLLGMPTIMGWSGHEWTWRGTNEGLDERRTDVVEVYTGNDISKTISILKKYDIEYIIVGTTENRIYKNQVNRTKLLSLGTVIFENQNIIIILTKSY